MNGNSTIYQTILLISSGFMLLYLFFDHRMWLHAAVTISVLSLLSFRVASWINKVWQSIGKVLGFINSKIILSLVYTLILLPVACWYRVSKQKTIQLSKQDVSMWVERKHRYNKDDLKNLW